MKRIFLAAFTAITLLVSGCAPSSQPAPVNEPPATEQPSEEPVAEVASRVISVAPSITEILFAIGAGEQVVGVDNYSNYPEAVNELTRVGDLMGYNLEQMVALEPDLVLAIPGTETLVEQLKEKGIEAQIVDPQSLSEVYDTIVAIGELTGHAAEASAVVADMKARVEQVEAKVAHLSAEEKPLVFYEVWDNPLMTAGPGSFIDQLITLAGGRNLGQVTEAAWAEISLEVVAEQNPDIILSPNQPFIDQLRGGELPAWASFKAVENDRIYLVEDDLVSRSGPRLVEGLEQLASFLHPDLFNE